jgi:guanylate kinase
MSDPSHKVIIITAPSGAGKTSITHYLMQRIPRLRFSVSATTRLPRPKEQNGVDYYFISTEEFKKQIGADAFIEHEMVYEGLYYGTLKSEVDRIWSLGQVPLLDIDVQGAINVQKRYSGNTLSLFIQPPSMEELKRRLEKRGTETPASLARRLEKASYELTFINEFDAVIVNDNLEEACGQAGSLVEKFLQETQIRPNI